MHDVQISSKIKVFSYVLKERKTERKTEAKRQINDSFELSTPLLSQNRGKKGKGKSRVTKTMRALEVNHGLHLGIDSVYLYTVMCKIHINI